MTSKRASTAVGHLPFDNAIEKPQSGRWRGANCRISSTVPPPLLISPCPDLQILVLRPRKTRHAGVRRSLTSVYWT
jgi:hypothetical protein